MKILLFTLIGLAFAVIAYGAAGDKMPGWTAKFHNISSSTKAAKARGEIRHDADYLYINISTAARPHWRRVELGGSF